MMIQPQRFEVSLEKDRLEDMHRRLAATRWPLAIGEDGWDYGTPIEWLKSMTRHWLDEWCWKTEAAAINQYAHYRVEIDGIPIHYLHAPAADPDAPPLVLTHGWPWTFWDFKDVIGPLSKPEEYGGSVEQAFNVYVPSLPGFGFSTPLRSPGVDVPRVADLWVKLMTEVLGYDRFAAHGGDWGALITAHLSHAHADKLTGAHMSLTLIPGVDRAELTPDKFAEDEQWMIERNIESAPIIESHLSVHRLDPQTLGMALADSPLGTAAWIWERRRNWSDCNGNVESVFSRDHLCTTAAIYWCTGAINSSLRIYYEHFNKPWPLVHDRSPRLEAPCAFAVLPKDVVHMPRAVLETHCNLQQYRVMDRGGHFGAAEDPQAIVEDLRRFFFQTLL